MSRSMKSYSDYESMFDGDVFCFVRKIPNNGKWQVRIKVPGTTHEKAIRRALHTTDRAVAISLAKQLYHQALTRHGNKQPIVATSWDALVAYYRQERRPKKKSKFEYDLKTYLQDFFGQVKDINNIDTPMMSEFWEWRFNRWKDWTKPHGSFATNDRPAHAKPIPRLTTLKGLRASINSILKFAHEQALLTRLPNLEIQDEIQHNANQIVTRGEFSNQAYKTLWMSLAARSKILERRQTTPGNLRQQRIGLERLRFAVLLISNTSIRPSELLKLCHVHIQREPGDRKWEREAGVHYTTILIPANIAKTKIERKMVSHDYDRTYGYYMRFKKVLEEYDHPTEPTDLIFGSTRNPEKPTLLAAYFRKVLQDFGLLEDWSQGKTPRNRSMYSLRSYAITKALERMVPIHVVAVNSGTSSRCIEKSYSKVISWTMRDVINQGRIRRMTGEGLPDYSLTPIEQELQWELEATNSLKV